MALEHITSGFYEGLTLTQIEELIYWELGQVTGTTISYERFPKWLTRRKLNDRQNKFVFHSQCILKTALLTVKEDYRRYKLPLNCMHGGVTAAQYFISSTSYEDLDIVDREYLHENFEGWLTDGSSQPEYVVQGEMYGNIPMIDVYPTPDSDGTSYASGDDTGIAVGDDLPAATSNIDGTATGGGATTLQDTATTFTDYDLQGGMYVRNNTDSSSAPILSVATNTITLASALSGGTANTFSAGDSYTVLAGEYGVVTSWADDDQILFGAEVGLLAEITVPAGNIRIEYIPYPMQFPDSGNPLQKPEIPRLYHHDLAMGVVSDFLGSFHEKSREFQRAKHYDDIFNAAVTNAMGKKESSPFKRKPVRFRPMRMIR